VSIGARSLQGGGLGAWVIFGLNGVWFCLDGSVSVALGFDKVVEAGDHTREIQFSTSGIMLRADVLLSVARSG
jgi:hypothetical protein